MAQCTSHRIVLFGKHPNKLALVSSVADTHVIAEVEKFLNEFDAVVDVTGSPNGMQAALQLVRPLGTIVLKSTCAESTLIEHSYPDIPLPTTRDILEQQLHLSSLSSYRHIYLEKPSLSV